MNCMPLILTVCHQDRVHLQLPNSPTTHTHYPICSHTALAHTRGKLKTPMPTLKPCTYAPTHARIHTYAAHTLQYPTPPTSALYAATFTPFTPPQKPNHPHTQAPIQSIRRRSLALGKGRFQRLSFIKRVFETTMNKSLDKKTQLWQPCSVVLP